MIIPEDFFNKLNQRNMNSIQAHFANHLGKKICYKFGTEHQKELILQSVNKTYIMGLNGDPDKPVIATFNECYLIFDNKTEIMEVDAPRRKCLVRVSEKTLLRAEQLFKKTSKEIYEDLVRIGCECSEITEEEFNLNFTDRKKKYLWPRQIIMVVMNKLEKHSLEKSAKYFGKDHATTLNAIKTISDLSETDKRWVEKYYDMIKYVVDNYGDKAELVFNLKHFNR